MGTPVNRAEPSVIPCGAISSLTRRRRERTSVRRGHRHDRRATGCHRFLDIIITRLRLQSLEFRESRAGHGQFSGAQIRECGRSKRTRHLLDGEAVLLEQFAEEIKFGGQDRHPDPVVGPRDALVAGARGRQDVASPVCRAVFGRELENVGGAPARRMLAPGRASDKECRPRGRDRVWTADNVPGDGDEPRKKQDLR